MDSSISDASSHCPAEPSSAMQPSSPPTNQPQPSGPSLLFPSSSSPLSSLVRGHYTTQRQWDRLRNPEQYQRLPGVPIDEKLDAVLATMKEQKLDFSSFIHAWMGSDRAAPVSDFVLSDIDV
jgi:hypothetical protein